MVTIANEVSPSMTNQPITPYKITRITNYRYSKNCENLHIVFMHGGEAVSWSIASL
ncbi:MAG: hypothetical protein FWG98_15600 [Candidatus Cloacimonetes bacterium]|nr:hypothetical protein [Candidatus Cloacimonadota bacterium]